MTDHRRWYDRDPLLQEAMELLCLSPDDSKDMAAEYILKLQDQVAADVIERVYETITKFQDKGNRWYDNDPVMIKAVELLRVAPPHVQRAAAKKLIHVLTRDDLKESNPDQISEEK
ncbi:MAG: hypothetical protein PHC34_00075 [Candidatus Gastranaerophilales bacterium]|nr:hypothetical protein [Candidatus Gastranaerophilales bacterium]